jgi:hypothetical protein
VYLQVEASAKDFPHRRHPRAIVCEREPRAGWRGHAELVPLVRARPIAVVQEVLILFAPVRAAHRHVGTECRNDRTASLLAPRNFEVFNAQDA